MARLKDKIAEIADAPAAPADRRRGRGTQKGNSLWPGVRGPPALGLLPELDEIVTGIAIGIEHK